MFRNENSTAKALNEAEEAHRHTKFANMKCQRVKVDDAFVPALEDDTIEMQHLLAEPKTNHVSVDGVLRFDKENPWKCSGIEDFSFGLEFGLKGDFGGLDANTQGDDDLGFGVLDGLLDGVEEVDDIHAANDISGACEDFLLDIELAEKFSEVDCAPCSDSQSPGFTGSSNGVLGLSESSTATIPESDCKIGSLVKTVKYELNESSFKWDSLASTEDNVYPTSGDPDEMGNEEKPLLSGGMLSVKNSKKSLQATRFSTVGQKRSRKPTKRFVEEFSNRKSNHVMERGSSLISASKDKRPKIRSHNEFHHEAACIKESGCDPICHVSLEDVEKLSDLKRIIERNRMLCATSKDKLLKIKSQGEIHEMGAVKLAQRECCTGTSTQTAFESRPRRGRPRKCVPHSFAEPDYEHTASECEGNKWRRRPKTNADRRKHQRMWTSSEVLKLVDGIAEYGTGRWTDIKKFMFSSSAHRTPVDLRDKWRNLLRASCAIRQKQKKKEVEKKPKQPVRPLPKAVLCRIRELASIHPYPRFSPGGRYIRNKKN